MKDRQMKDSFNIDELLDDVEEKAKKKSKKKGLIYDNDLIKKK